MIVVCELQFSNWGHEECNCGVLNLLANAFPNERICFYGEKGHIKCLREIGLNARVACSEISIKDSSCAWRKEHEPFYRDAIKSVLKQSNIFKNDFLFFLASPNALLSAFLAIAKNADFKTFFIQHANMDWLLQEGRGRDFGYSSVDLLDSTKDFPNVKFIAYNPYCRKSLGKILNNEVLNKFCFLNHAPSVNKGDPILNGNVIKIGVYGACQRSMLFFDLLRGLHEKYRNEVLGKIEFNVIKAADMHNLDCSFLYPKFCVVKQTLNGFSRAQKERFVNQMDWILLPYDSSEYRVSMSGILADAIGFEKPFLGLNSPILEYYNNKAKPIGVIKNTTEELAAYIANELPMLSKGAYNKYVESQGKMKQIVADENVRLIKKMVAL